MTRNLAVVGSPIDHSKSPLIHSAAYTVLGKSFDYSKIRIEKNHLRQFIETLDSNWLGLSVTAPLKVEALRLAVKADETSTITNAANTLLQTDEGWVAFNTDVFGMQKALEAANIGEPKLVSVVGSGATAISAVLAAHRRYPTARIQIAARNRDSAEEVLNFGKAIGVRKMSLVSLPKALSTAQLVVSTLPAGVIDESIRRLSKSWFSKPSGVLFDVAYEPWPSRAAQLWKQNNLQVISGIEMLLWQALAQIRIFTEGDPSVEVFNEPAVMLAMRDALGLI
jgi:shikimate dehydrogenase